MGRGSWLLVALSTGLLCRGQDLKKAEDLYQHTDYAGSLKVLQSIQPQTAEAAFLAGRDYFGLGQLKQATDSFQKAFSSEPHNSDYALWVGRAWGRRAEIASPLTAPLAAAKARQYFELAVKLNPKNGEATGDLFDFYLNAPGFLGGGLDKAAALARVIAQNDEAEGHFAAAVIADHRKQYDTAEQHFRRAMDLAPRQVGRIIDLARYLAKRGRIQESEATFARAEKLAPQSPKLLFSHAKTYIETKNNLDRARELLKRYLQSNLTPEDPSKEEAEKLLKKASGA